MSFGRIDLRKGASKAKFDARSDFEVRLAVAPQKPKQNSKKCQVVDLFSVSTNNPNYVIRMGSTGGQQFQQFNRR